MPSSPFNDPDNPTHVTTIQVAIEIWRTGLWRFFPFLALYCIGFAVLLPVTPMLMTNAFASAAAKEHVDCGKFSPSDAPVVCRDAHSTVVLWSIWTGFVSSAVVNFFTAPLIGSLSDKYGRKPFMLLGQVLGMLPVMVLLAHVQLDLPIYWYFLANILNGAVSSYAMTLMAVADLLAPLHRATASGLLSACLSVGVILGQMVGGYIPSVTAALYVGLAVTVLVTLYTLLVLPECAPVKARAQRAQQAAQRAQRAAAVVRSAALAPASLVAAAVPEKQALLGPRDEERGGAPDLCSAGDDGKQGVDKAEAVNGWKMMMSTPLFLKLAAISALQNLTWTAAQDLLIQYLQLVLGFGPRQTANLFSAWSGSALILKLFLLNSLVNVLGEQVLLVLAMVLYSVETIVLANVRAEWMAYFAMTFGSFSAAAPAASLSILSANVRPEHLGAVQGAISGLSALASGIGPIAFAYLFAAFTRSDSPLPYCPAAPWFLLTGLALATAALAATLHRDMVVDLALSRRNSLRRMWRSWSSQRSLAAAGNSGAISETPSLKIPPFNSANDALQTFCSHKSTDPCDPSSDPASNPTDLISTAGDTTSPDLEPAGPDVAHHSGDHQ